MSLCQEKDKCKVLSITGATNRRPGDAQTACAGAHGRDGAEPAALGTLLEGAPRRRGGGVPAAPAGSFPAALSA